MIKSLFHFMRKCQAGLRVAVVFCIPPQYMSGPFSLHLCQCLIRLLFFLLPSESCVVRSHSMTLGAPKVFCICLPSIKSTRKVQESELIHNLVSLGRQQVHMLQSHRDAPISRRDRTKTGKWAHICLARLQPTRGLEC